MTATSSTPYVSTAEPDEKWGRNLKTRHCIRSLKRDESTITVTLLSPQTAKQTAEEKYVVRRCSGRTRGIGGACNRSAGRSAGSVCVEKGPLPSEVVQADRRAKRYMESQEGEDFREGPDTGKLHKVDVELLHQCTAYP